MTNKLRIIFRFYSGTDGASLGDLVMRWISLLVYITALLALLLRSVNDPFGFQLNAQLDIASQLVIYAAVAVSLHAGIKAIGEQTGHKSFLGGLGVVLKRVSLYIFLPAFAVTAIMMLVMWLTGDLH